MPPLQCSPSHAEVGRDRRVRVDDVAVLVLLQEDPAAEERDPDLAGRNEAHSCSRDYQ